MKVLTANNILFLLGIFIFFIPVGILLRVVIKSNCKKDLFVRLKTLFFLQFIHPLVFPLVLIKKREELLSYVNNDASLTEEKRESFSRILSDEENLKKICKTIPIQHFLHFKRMLDMNIEYLNRYRAEKDKELHVSITISFKGLNIIPYLAQNLFIQGKIHEHINKHY